MLRHKGYKVEARAALEQAEELRRVLEQLGDSLRSRINIGQVNEALCKGF